MPSVGIANGDSFCCGNFLLVKTVTYKYKEGSVLYSLQKAQLGILETIVIKRVRLVTSKATFGQIIVLYIDTFNGLWNENMLCTGPEATSLATAYLLQQQQALMDELNSC